MRSGRISRLIVFECNHSRAHRKEGTSRYCEGPASQGYCDLIRRVEVAGSPEFWHEVAVVGGSREGVVEAGYVWCWMKDIGEGDAASIYQVPRYRGLSQSPLTLGSPYARECERSSMVCLLEGLCRMSLCLGLGFASRVKPQSPCTFEARLWR